RQVLVLVRRGRLAVCLFLCGGFGVGDDPACPSHAGGFVDRHGRAPHWLFSGCDQLRVPVELVLMGSDFTVQMCTSLGEVMLAFRDPPANRLAAPGALHPITRIRDEFGAGLLRALLLVT